MDISKDKLLWMYERMQLIRTFENRVKVEFGERQDSWLCSSLRRGRSRRGWHLFPSHRC